MRMHLEEEQIKEKDGLLYSILKQEPFLNRLEM